MAKKVAEANRASSRTVLNYFADRHVAAPLLDTLKAFTQSHLTCLLFYVVLV
jgi:hypothetical protein